MATILKQPINELKKLKQDIHLVIEAFSNLKEHLDQTAVHLETVMQIVGRISVIETEDTEIHFINASRPTKEVSQMELRVILLKEITSNMEHRDY
jgi:hypothetical protein